MIRDNEAEGCKYLSRCTTDFGKIAQLLQQNLYDLRKKEDFYTFRHLLDSENA